MKTIRITQLLRPSGKPAVIFAEVPDEYYQIARLLDISCEAIPPWHVAIYAHVKGQSDEDELSEIANNGRGENSPSEALIRLIKRFEGVMT